MMIILVDQDGPLANFEEHLLNRWRQRYPNEPYVPLAERRAMIAADDYPEHLRQLVRSIYHEPGFYATIPPVASGLLAIRAMNDARHLVRICTSPLIGSRYCVAEKWDWIERHLGRGGLERTIITRDKTLVHGDLLIDDKPQRGDHEPAWRLALYDMPFNRSAELAGIPRLNADWSNWEDVLDAVAAPRV